MIDAARIPSVLRCLVRMGALEVSHGGHARQDPGQLADLRHIALAPEDCSRGIQSEGEEDRRHIVGPSSHLLFVMQACERVIIRDEVEGLVLVLQRNRRPNHAQIVSEVWLARRLYS